MRDIYFSTMAVESKYSPEETVESLRTIIEADPQFGPIDESVHENEVCTYTRLETEYAMSGDTAELYYQTHDLRWPKVRFIVNVKQESNTAVVYSKSADLLPQTLSNEAQRKAEAIIDAAKISDKQLSTEVNYKAIGAVVAGIAAFVVIMSLFA